MGAFRLNTYVYAVEVDDKGRPTGRETMFGPDDDLSTPDNRWALTAITNEDVWAVDKPPRHGEVVQQGSPGVDPGPAPDVGLPVPPRRGPGSGSPEWRAYARSLDVQVAEDASRDDVIGVLEAAGKPTK